MFKFQLWRYNRLSAFQIYLLLRVLIGTWNTVLSRFSMFANCSSSLWVRDVIKGSIFPVFKLGTWKASDKRILVSMRPDQENILISLKSGKNMLAVEYINKNIIIKTKLNSITIDVINCSPFFICSNIWHPILYIWIITNNILALETVWKRIGLNFSLINESVNPRYFSNIPTRFGDTFR